MTRRRSLLAVVGCGVPLYFLPSVAPTLGLTSADLLFLYSLLFWMTQATAWNLFTGYSGYFNFGTAAFFGVGAYTSAVLAAEYGVNFFVTILLAGLAAALLATLLAVSVFRLRVLSGLLFALLTFALTFVGSGVASASRFIDGGKGRVIGIPSYPSFLGDYPSFIFRAGLVLAVLTIAVAIVVFYSKLGSGLFAIRDQEAVAESLGVPTFRYKLIAFALSCGIAGASAALHTVQMSYMTPPEAFDVGGITLGIILICFVGGRSHWLGPLIGALVVYTATSRLTRVELAEWSDIIRGTGLVLVMFLARDGIYVRMRRHPIRCAAPFAAIMLALGLSGTAGAWLDRLAIALVATVVWVLLPDPRRALGRLLRMPGRGAEDVAPREASS